MTYRPRLAIVTDAVAPWHSGGKETRTREYSQRLARNGFDVDIYTMKWWPGGPVTTQGPVRLHAICRRWPLYAGQRRSLLQAVAFSFACLRLLTARFDVVEVDQIPILPLVVVKAVCAIRRKPLIATWHEVWGMAYWRRYLGPLGAVAAVAEQLVMRLPDRIIAVSDATAARVREVTRGRIPVFVGYNGVDAQHIRDAPAETACSDLLFVGRLLEHKGVDVAIEAVAELSRRGTPLSLTIVGRGPERDALTQQVADLGLTGQVTFTGELPTHADVIGAMKTARLMVFPTRREGFGLAAIEAMACGVPVITADHPDNFARLLVTPGHDGYLCRPDGSDLPDLILAALAERGRLSAGAVRTARRFSWQQAVTDCVGAYDVTPAGRPRRRSVVAAVVACAVVLLAATLSGACAKSAPKPAWVLTAAGSHVGIAYGDNLFWMSDAELTATLDDAVALGARWIRADLSWPNIQPELATAYDWGRFDRVVNAVSERGLTLLPILAYTPAWARPAGCSSEKCPPAKPEQFATFAGQAASRYRGVTAWEIWNEPNTQGFWQPQPDPAAYGEVLRQSTDAIKTVNPAAQVISGGLSITSPSRDGITPQDFIAALVRAGAMQRVDGVGLHPYTYPNVASERGPWVSPREDANTGLQSIRSIFTDAGRPAPPIWITEYGAPTGGQPDSDDHVSEARQAQIAADAVKTAYADADVAALMWYTYRDSDTGSTDPEDNYGLRRSDGSKKPAYDALKQAIATG